MEQQERVELTDRALVDLEQWGLNQVMVAQEHILCTSSFLLRRSTKLKASGRFVEQYTLEVCQDECREVCVVAALL